MEIDTFSKGSIISIKDVVIEVEFLDDPKPGIHEIIKLEADESVIFEIVESSGVNRFHCINLSGKSNFSA